MYQSLLIVTLFPLALSCGDSSSFTGTSTSKNSPNGVEEVSDEVRAQKQGDLPPDTGGVEDENTTDQDNNENEGKTTTGNDSTSQQSGGPISDIQRTCEEGPSNSAYNNIQFSGGAQEIVLVEDSLVFLELTGNVTVTFPQNQVAKILGLCIHATGGAALTLNSSLNLGLIYYFGRGNATSTINFIENGTFEEIKADVGGTHLLKIVGDKDNCEAKLPSSSGSGSVICVD